MVLILLSGGVQVLLGPCKKVETGVSAQALKTQLDQQGAKHHPYWSYHNYFVLRFIQAQITAILLEQQEK